jgi:DNA polymerase
MNQAPDREKIAALIDWYRLAGVDAFIDTAPVDRFEVARRAAAAPRPGPAPVAAHGHAHAPGPAHHHPHPHHPAPTPPPLPGAPAVSPAEALAEARELAARSHNLVELKTALAGFDGCALKPMAKNLCFADGNPSAKLMLIGEAPGRDEDLAGVPFVGRAGQLLDRMLAAAGLERSKDVWITNTVFWRPPGNRVPSTEETEVCRPFLERQIELLQPDLILALGGAAAKQLLDAPGGIMRLRGKWHEIEVAGRQYDVLPTLHPAYLLRNPVAKKLAWRDLLIMLEKRAQLTARRA